jgi:hypothetical protein
MVRETRGKHTTIQIHRPGIVKTPIGGVATEDEELGTDQRHGMVASSAGPRTIDHDAGPLLRFWDTRNSDRLERVLT